MSKAEIPSFRKALAQSPDAVAELSDNSFWRYSNGIFPKAVDWLVRHPNLLRALADDAERQQTAN